VSLDLLGEFADARVRKLGVRVSNLEFGGEQAKLGTYADGRAGGSDGDRAGRDQAPERSRRGQTTFGDF